MKIDKGHTPCSQPSRAATTMDKNISGGSPSPVNPIVGSSPQLMEVLRLARRAAIGDAKVLVTGESGVGKDLVAREIHTHSLRAHGPFVAVNCAGLTETLLESELFGHVKGSFTGAYRDKLGKLEMAHGGTLFLDEVGEMSLRMQALLLRFLEQGELQRVGATDRARYVDVRVVAATNRNLGERVAAGEFREDLLYRLRVIHIHVPPLRERRGDIRPLVEHFATNRRKPTTFSAKPSRSSSAIAGPATSASSRTSSNRPSGTEWTGKSACPISRSPFAFPTHSCSPRSAAARSPTICTRRSSTAATRSGRTCIRCSWRATSRATTSASSFATGCGPRAGAIAG